MSIEAMVWALNTIVGDPTRKLVLVAYANHAHKDGASAWASAESIAEYAECSERTVQRHTSALIEMGLLREGDQEVIPARIPKRHRPIVYDLAMSEDVRADWAASPVPGRRAAMVAGGRKGADKRNLLRSVPNMGRQIDAPSDPEGKAADQGTPAQPDEPWGDNRGDNRGDTGVTQTKEQTKRQPKGQKTAPATPSPDDDPTIPGVPGPPPTLDQRAEALLREWWDEVAALHPTRVPTQSYISVKGVVRHAMSNGKPDRLIWAGLYHLIHSGQAISGGSLQRAMTEVAGMSNAPAEFRPYAVTSPQAARGARSSADDAVAEAAARYEAMKAAGRSGRAALETGETA